MKKQFFIIGLIIITSLNSCKKTNEKHVKKVKTEHKHQNKHWSYEGDTAPEHWSSISDKNLACGGNSQSPINIETAKLQNSDTKNTLSINYQKTGVDIVNNGHTEEFVVSEGNTMTFNEKAYTLRQFHMHTLSENTVDGKHLPLEIHFVNKATDGTFAVISVLFKEGEESKFFNKYLGHFPQEKGKEYKDNTKLNILEVLPKTTHYFHYKGSFTTPPCTEVVEWIILTENPTASKEQLEKLHQLMGDNFRPIQALNNRTVEVQ